MRIAEDALTLVKLDAITAGEVEKIYVREGQEVKAGQPILTLDSLLTGV
jgi:HlyD family secretion protein